MPKTSKLRSIELITRVSRLPTCLLGTFNNSLKRMEHVNAQLLHLMLTIKERKMYCKLGVRLALILKLLKSRGHQDLNSCCLTIILNVLPWSIWMNLSTKKSQILLITLKQVTVLCSATYLIGIKLVNKFKTICISTICWQC